MTRVQVNPDLLRWACERCRIDGLQLSRRFPQLEAWERGAKQPTLKQLEAFAKATQVPFGFLFLPAPPAEPLPIADFRERAPGPPSGNLLDTIYAAQRRQDWFKEYATTERLDRSEWVGSATLETEPADTAARLRQLLGFEIQARKEHASWEVATKALVDRAQGLGVLVSISGVVGSNTLRTLDPGEFRGFSLVDELAPFIFVNGADHKAAHAFTLCHELAHLALGCPGLSNEDLGAFRADRVEAWCDTVASEILAPSSHVGTARAEAEVPNVARELTRELRVSPLVAVRRVSEHSQLTEGAFTRCYQAAVAALPTRGASSGGNYYATTLRRVGHRLARDVIASTLEGNTTFSEAFRLLGIRNSTVFDELARRLGLTQ
jgi:Zn-dependent peptidase ImmA (M78 family)